MWPAVGLLRGHGGDEGSQMCEHPPPTPQLQVRTPYGCLNPLMDPGHFPSFQDDGGMSPLPPAGHSKATFSRALGPELVPVEGSGVGDRGGRRGVSRRMDSRPATDEVATLVS